MRIEANVITYNSCMSACVQGSQWQMALELFFGMPRALLKADTASWRLFNSLFCC